MEASNGQPDESNQQKFIDKVGTLIDSLNNLRESHATNDSYDQAQAQLENINQVRQHAQQTIKRNLLTKHENEGQQVEEYNCEEFQEFTNQWDVRMENVRQAITVQIKTLSEHHAKQLVELQTYLESSMTTRFNPSTELLNFRRIQ